jgi:hypothetical protein
MEAMLKMYRKPQHTKNLFERMKVASTTKTKGDYVKNQHSEVLNEYQQIRDHINNPNNPYRKKHHPTLVEYQAATDIIGHAVIVYTKNQQGHLEQANKFAPQGTPRGSPIVLVKSPQGTYSLDVQRTQHWSFSGGAATHRVNVTAQQLYHLVKKQTRLRLQTQLPNNEREYLEHHVNAIPPAINTHDLETLATILKRPIRTNPIMSTGYSERNSIRVTPSGWTGSKNSRDLVVLFIGNHYRTPQTHTPTNAGTPKPYPDLPQQVETLINVIEMSHSEKHIPPKDTPKEPTIEIQQQFLDKAQDIQAEVKTIDSPADARRADVAIHDLGRDWMTYITQHHPEDVPMVMEQAKTSPGLFNKLAKHTGSVVRASGRTAKGVVDRSSLGDLGVSGIAIVSGLSVLSSYTSVWRVFFG